jgi:hypothetical protein
MKMNINYIQTVARFILLGCVACLCFTACTAEEEIIAEGNNNSNNVMSEARVNFSLVMSFRMQTQTRASLNEEDEDDILAIRVLMFKETNGVMAYYFGASKSAIITVSPSQKNFDISLPTGQYDVVILANAQEILAQSNIALGDTKESVLKALVETNAGKWNRKTIPMWGQIKGLIIDAETGFDNNNTVEMVRMVAKIDLEVASSASSEFALANVRVYNYSSQGALAPDMSNWAPGNPILAPTQPDAPGGYAPISTPQVFDAADGVTAYECRRMIYVYEAPAGSAANLSGNTCLVVGGSYKGGAVTYYRIDFIGMENNQKVFLPLLRNNYYSVKIVSVSSNGYATPEEALTAPPINLETAPLNWTEKGMNHVVFDGNYMLGVSTNRLTIPADPQTIRTIGNKLTVMSTVPGGWAVEKITDSGNMPGTASWLTLYSLSPTATGDLFVCVAENTSSLERTGYIHIRSGKLQFRIEVVQSATYGFGLEIIDEQTWQEIAMLDFGNAAGQEKKFKVVWRPTTATMMLTVSHPGTAFAGTGVPSDASFASPDGWKEYAITTKSTPSNTLTRLDFTLSDGQANTESKTLFLRQRK